MAKILIPLGLIVVGAAAWFALAPAPVSERPERTAEAPEAIPAKAPTRVTQDDEPPRKVERAVVPKPARRPTVANAVPEDDRPEPVVKGPDGLPAPAVPDPRPVAPDGTRYGRHPSVQPPPLALSPVKSSVRQFYGSLPSSGKVPANVTLDEVFTDDVIRILNYPPQSKIKEFGSYPVTDAKAFKEFLAQPEDSPMPLGVTVVTPDGQELRDYIFFAPET